MLEFCQFVEMFRNSTTRRLILIFGETQGFSATSSFINFEDFVILHIGTEHIRIRPFSDFIVIPRRSDFLTIDDDIVVRQDFGLILLVVSVTQTGFGRTGTEFGQAINTVSPFVDD